MYPDVFVKTKDKFPNQPHWVIMLFSSMSWASSQPMVSYEAYLTEEKFLEALKEQEGKQYGSANYVAFKVEPLTVTKTVSVSTE